MINVDNEDNSRDFDEIDKSHSFNFIKNKVEREKKKREKERTKVYLKINQTHLIHKYLLRRFFACTYTQF